jgi:hypothetical protein
LSALRGIKNAAKGTYDTFRHPVQTAQSLVTALRNPRETARSAIADLRADFKEDPISATFEALTPLPSPLPNALRKRDIFVPDKMAHPSEYKHIANAIKEYSEKRDPRMTWKAADMQLQLLQDIADNNGGWFPWGNHVWKDVGPAKIKQNLDDAGQGEFMALRDAFDHPEFMSRIANVPGFHLPEIIRGNHSELVSGHYLGREAARASRQKPHLVIGGLPRHPETLDTLNHELQHYAQDLGGVSPSFRGANMRNVGWENYMRQPGEVMARVAGLRARAGDNFLGAISPQRHLINEQLTQMLLRDPKRLNTFQHMDVKRLGPEKYAQMSNDPNQMLSLIHFDTDYGPMRDYPTPRRDPRGSR